MLPFVGYWRIDFCTVKGPPTCEKFGGETGAVKATEVGEAIVDEHIASSSEAIGQTEVAHITGVGGRSIGRWRLAR